MRLGILSTHPIQYQAPWFRALARQVQLEVYFMHRQTEAEQGQAGFGVAFEWDVDLLSGYESRFLKNIAARPSVFRFYGCDTPEIGDIIQRKRFDAFIVTGWNTKSYLQAVRACRHAGVPVLVRGDSQLRSRRSLPKRLAMEVRQRWLVRQFDGFLTVGKRNREYLEHFGARPARIFFAPHFVDNDWFAARVQAGSGKERETRAQWGVGDETLVTLFVGKFIKKKRPGDLLRALSRLRAQSVNASGVFVGAGELERELRASAEQLGVRAQFVGFKNQTELPACYAGADVLVLPSDGDETWGLVVNEAMACGLPAIVSDAAGCAPDLIDPGRTGFVFPIGDEAALAGRLAALAALKVAGHDFTPDLQAKMRDYSLENATRGTLGALAALAPVHG